MTIGVQSVFYNSDGFLVQLTSATEETTTFPFSSSIWMAAGLLWVLDAANNTAMEPYRAFIGDKLPENQQTSRIPLNLSVLHLST